MINSVTSSISSRTYTIIYPLILVLLCVINFSEAAPYEPPGNQVLFGAWLDTAAGKPLTL